MASIEQHRKNLPNFIAITSRLVGATTKGTILCGAKREYQLKCSEAKKAMKRLWDFEGEKHEPSL
jgi:hypothetical protein